MDSKNIEQVPEGYLIRQPNNVSSLTLVMAVLKNAILWGFLLWQVALIARILTPILKFLETQPIFWFIAIILGLMEFYFIYDGIKVLYEAIDQSLLGFNLFPAEIIFPNYPLSLGEEAAIIYRRRLRSGKAILDSGTFNASLTCTEEVRYTVGTDTSTDREIVLTRKVPEVLIPAYEPAIDIIFRFKIPIGAAPSFQASSNKIIWKIMVDINLPRLAHDSSEFLVEVQPEVFE